jgi:putative Flp pilus-assembly TadE/G-like protein
MDKIRRWAREQRGSILLFTTILVVPLMIIIGGLAMDLAYYGAVDDELQRSMDSAALAGAGKLGFNDTFFPAARTWARDYALLNPYRTGNINLNLNSANTPGGNIVLGIWNGTTFAPSLDGTRVNAVQCRFATTVPTSFLRLVGVNNLNAGAMAIAWAAQPGTTPPNACVFPVALSSCFFGGSTSVGCGATIRLISSSTGSAVEGNTASWINLALGATSVPAGNPEEPNSVRGQIALAASGNCTGTALNTGTQIPSTNGDLNSAINDLMTIFPEKYASSPADLTVLKQDGTPAYVGHGWEVFVPVIDTGSGCPPTVINGPQTIAGWSRMVITQVYSSGANCAVANHWPGNDWDQHCLASKNGTVASMSDLPSGWSGQKGLFGYYDCQYSPSPPAPNPGPITATAKLKLVR